jgi:hypothetical protein
MVGGWQRSHDPQRLVGSVAASRGIGLNTVSIAQGCRAIPGRLRAGSSGGRARRTGRAQTSPKRRSACIRKGWRVPDDNLFRERLMWLYVDQGNTAELKPLLTQWKARAREDRILWLPFASASQMLGRDSGAGLVSGCTSRPVRRIGW